MLNSVEIYTMALKRDNKSKMFLCEGLLTILTASSWSSLLPISCCQMIVVNLQRNYYSKNTIHHINRITHNFSIKFPGSMTKRYYVLFTMWYECNKTMDLCERLLQQQILENRVLWSWTRMRTAPLCLPKNDHISMTWYSNDMGTQIL